jgi:hypothetical protein
MVLVILPLFPGAVFTESLKIRFEYHDFSGTAGIHIAESKHAHFLKKAV